MKSTYEYQQNPFATNGLSVVLIGPDDVGRQALVDAFLRHQMSISGELGSYPNFSHLEKLTGLECDVVLVDLDADPEVALELVENICSRSTSITVMVYSQQRDPELLLKCMRAGAREFLAAPISPEVLEEVLARASGRRQQKKVAGKVLVFWGAKGGTGVTTLASNFAIALKKQSSKGVALVDLNIELGDIAVYLGLNPMFSVSDALRHADRLDQDFVETLLVEHKTGVSVLAASDTYSPDTPVQNGSLGKLLYVLAHKFPYVVVDAGPGLGEGTDAVFDMADSVYLVAEADIASLRNAERLITHLQRPGGREHQVALVLNRFDPRRLEITEERIAKVLSAGVKWKVPNDYAGVKRSLNNGVPLALGGSPVSGVLDMMAREACGKPLVDRPKKRWGLF